MNPIPTLTDHVRPTTFPWPEIRDFIAVFNALAQTQQNVVVGDQMMGAEPDEAKKIEIAQKLAGVRLQAADLQIRAQALNDQIEAKLRALEGNAPRLVLPY